MISLSRQTSNTYSDFIFLRGDTRKASGYRSIFFDFFSACNKDEALQGTLYVPFV